LVTDEWQEKLRKVESQKPVPSFQKFLQTTYSQFGRESPKRADKMEFSFKK